MLAPKSKADLAFTMHMLSWLAVNGTAAIVEFPGVLYRGGAEQKIRKYLIDNNYVDTVIQLPPDLFFGTTIATCIIVLKKSQERQQDPVHRRVRRVRPRATRTSSPRRTSRRSSTHSQRARTPTTSRSSSRTATSPTNGYNIAVSSYVEAEDTREAVDITALNAEIAGSSRARPSCAQQIDAIVADLEERPA